MLKTTLRLLVVVLFVAPLVLVLSGSLRKIGLPPPEGLELLPPEAALDGYRRLPDEVPLGTAFRNSTIVVAVAVPLGVVIASSAGYVLSQLSARWRRRGLAVVVVMLVIPLPMLWVARFVLYLELGLLDTLFPLILPAVAASTPVAVLLAYRAFSRIPPELWEAARAEGASALRTWWSVGLPMVRATTTAIAALVFSVHWGAYLDALLFVQSSDTTTLPLAVATLRNLDPTELPIGLAGAAALALPPLILLLVAQRMLLSSVDTASER